MNNNKGRKVLLKCQKTAHNFNSLICYHAEPAIAIEINGDDVIPSLQALAPQFTTKCGDKLENIMYISPSLEAAKESIGKIFEQVNIEIQQ